MAACDSGSLQIDDADGSSLAWYRSSGHVVRGFCTRCGGNLFWRDEWTPETYITLGTLDRPTGLKLAGHIFVGSMGDYYAIDDDLPKHETW